MSEDKPKFTPGPWYVYDTRERAEHAYDYYITAGQYFVAAVSPDSLNIQEANANLIAAAPEMYEMLERLQKGHKKGNATWQLIERVLAKARGEVAP